MLTEACQGLCISATILLLRPHPTKMTDAELIKYTAPSAALWEPNGPRERKAQGPTTSRYPVQCTERARYIRKAHVGDEKSDRK